MSTAQTMTISESAARQITALREKRGNPKLMLRVTVLGGGCQTVQRGTTAGGKIEVTGTWSGGRQGVLREDSGFHGLARGSKGEMPVGSFDGYVPLVREIIKFFQTGVAPVKPEETIEIFAFMEAADESKQLNSAPVKIKELIRRGKSGK